MLVHTTTKMVIRYGLAALAFSSAALIGLTLTTPDPGYCTTCPLQGGSFLLLEWTATRVDGAPVDEGLNVTQWTLSRAVSFQYPHVQLGVIQPTMSVPAWLFELVLETGDCTTEEEACLGR